jgi:hypothetical protein
MPRRYTQFILMLVLISFFFLWETIIMIDISWKTNTIKQNGLYLIIRPYRLLIIIKLKKGMKICWYYWSQKSKKNKLQHFLRISDIIMRTIFSLLTLSLYIKSLFIWSMATSPSRQCLSNRYCNSSILSCMYMLEHW